MYWVIDDAHRATGYQTELLNCVETLTNQF